MGKKKVSRRRLGREGKHESIIGRAKWTGGWSDRNTDILDDIARYEAGAREVLQSKGLPTESPVVSDDGSTRQHLVKYLEDRELEPEWRAAKILEAAENARRHMENSDVKHAIRAAMILQEHVDLLKFSEWEYYGRIGKAQSRLQYSNDDWRRWERMADKLRQKHPDLPLREIARQIAEVTKDRESSIRPHITKYYKGK